MKTRWRCDLCGCEGVVECPASVAAEKVLGLLLVDHRRVSPACEFDHHHIEITDEP